MHSRRCRAACISIIGVEDDLAPGDHARYARQFAETSAHSRGNRPRRVGTGAGGAPVAKLARAATSRANSVSFRSVARHAGLSQSLPPHPVSSAGAIVSSPSAFHGVVARDHNRLAGRARAPLALLGGGVPSSGSPRPHGHCRPLHWSRVGGGDANLPTALALGIVGAVVTTLDPSFDADPSRGVIVPTAPAVVRPSASSCVTPCEALLPSSPLSAHIRGCQRRVFVRPSRMACIGNSPSMPSKPRTSPPARFRLLTLDTTRGELVTTYTRVDPRIGTLAATMRTSDDAAVSDIQPPQRSVGGELSTTDQTGGGALRRSFEQSRRARRVIVAAVVLAALFAVRRPSTINGESSIVTGFSAAHHIGTDFSAATNSPPATGAARSFSRARGHHRRRLSPRNGVRAATAVGDRCSLMRLVTYPRLSS